MDMEVANPMPHYSIPHIQDDVLCIISTGINDTAANSGTMYLI